ncbi:MAG: nucleotidyltransferase family protein [Nanoarchaeota archaeon]|nr:nucleotidyltransferase family protein [Nanoarchaeota archaeon]
MKAIIQAGGEGTRLRPITYEIPKPLIPVKKRAIVGHLVDLLQRHGIKDIAIIVSEKHKEDFKKWLRSEPRKARKRVSIIVEQKPSGTFGLVRNLKKWIGKESFAIVNGDTLLDIDVKKLVEFHAGHGKTGTLGLARVPDPKGYGVVLLDGERVLKFAYNPENPVSDLISSGFHIFTPDAFRHDTGEEVMMIDDDLLPRLIKEGSLMGTHIEGTRCYDCGTLERWEKAIKEW